MQDWDFINNLAVRWNVDPFGIRSEVDAIPDRRKLNSFGPNLYQDYLYAIVRITKPAIVVETGTRYGVGSSMILRALDANEKGDLYSCDPMHAGCRQAQEAMLDTHGFSSFDRFHFLPKPGYEALKNFATLNQPWDLFVHDSDHSKQNMAWELEYALGRVSQDYGILVCDDWDWPDEYDQFKQPHHALKTFCSKHGLEFHTVGTAAVVEL